MPKQVLNAPIGIIFCGKTLKLQFLKFGTFCINVHGNILKALLAIGYKFVFLYLFIFQQNRVFCYSVYKFKAFRYIGRFIYDKFISRILWRPAFISP